MIEVMQGANTPPKRSKRLIFLSGLFLFVLAVIIYSSFFADLSIIGHSISEGETQENIPILAELNSVPLITFNIELSSISLSNLEGEFFYVGDQRFSMNNTNKIFIANYKGKTTFNDSLITKLDGKASHVFVNNIPIFPSSGDDIKVYIEEPITYSSLEILEGYSKKKIQYTTSGKVLFGAQKSLVNLDKDYISIEEFIGKLKVINKRLFLEGNSQKLDISGSQEISISS